MIMATTLRIHFGGDDWEIRPELALVRERDRTVLVTDLHLGKSDHFRAAGIPVPHATDGDTLGRLDALLRGVDAQRLVILGDLFHDRKGVTGRAPRPARRLPPRVAGPPPSRTSAGTTTAKRGIPRLR